MLSDFINIEVNTLRNIFLEGWETTNIRREVLQLLHCNVIQYFKLKTATHHVRWPFECWIKREVFPSMQQTRFGPTCIPLLRRPLLHGIVDKCGWWWCEDDSAWWLAWGWEGWMGGMGSEAVKLDWLDNESSGWMTSWEVTGLMMHPPPLWKGKSSSKPFFGVPC